MPAGARFSCAVVSLGLLIVAFPALAHVPFLRPQLSRWIGTADCVAATRVSYSTAPSNLAMLRAAPILTWCGQQLPEALSLPAATNVPEGSWLVVFLQRSPEGWRVLATPGAFLSIAREDFRVVHRALSLAFFLRQRPQETAERRRLPWWMLLEASDPTWHYHAALELWNARHAGEEFTAEEVARLESLSQQRPNDPALGLLRQLRWRTPPQGWR